METWKLPAPPPSPLSSKTSLKGWKRVIDRLDPVEGLLLKNFVKGMETEVDEVRTVRGRVPQKLP